MVCWQSTLRGELLEFSGMVLGLFLCFGALAEDTGKSDTTVPPQPAVEQQACMTNLQTIYRAVQAYQQDRHSLPNWLSDLIPAYLADNTPLICPVCRRTGEAEASLNSDPELPSSYLYEFSPVTLGTAAPHAPTRTRREWKERQVALVGKLVPLVRCKHHPQVLNLSLDGSIYESGPVWEEVVTNQALRAQISAERVFPDESAPNVVPALEERQFARPSNAPRELLDLTDFYNASLTSAWHGNAGNDLSALPSGINSFQGIRFDVRGVIQLSGKSPGAGKFPASVTGIRVRQTCSRIHFLHAAGFGSRAEEGKQVGFYTIHFAENQARLEVPIIYGRDVRDWHWQPDEPAAAPELQVAWSGDNANTKQSGHPLRLFHTTWNNLMPGVAIESIDFTSSMSDSAPFLIAITVE